LLTKLIYKTNFTLAKMYTRQSLVSPHVRGAIVNESSQLLT